MFSSVAKSLVPWSDVTEIDFGKGLVKRRKREEASPPDLAGIYLLGHNDIVRTSPFIISGPAYPLPRVISPGPPSEVRREDGVVGGRRYCWLSRECIDGQKSI